MKEQFITKKFGATARQMIGQINEILEDYEQQGYDLSLRQLYYQLVSRNLVVNTERSYKNVGSLVSDARLAGLIDWDMIKDRGREMTQNPHWSNPKNFMDSVTPQFKIDLRSDQPNYIEVMVEKQALEGVLEPVCQTLDIPFTANKGYSSSSAMYEAGKRMGRHIQDGKNVYVIYLGDHDPSGIDMSRDVEDRLRQFAEIQEGDEPNIHIKRVALNLDQIRRLKPPENPAKITDSRAASYIAKFGRSSWELDAIEPRQLAKLVTDEVNDLTDSDLLDARKELQSNGRDSLTNFSDTFE